MSIISALGRLRQKGNCEFKANLNYIVNPGGVLNLRMRACNKECKNWLLYSSSIRGGCEKAKWVNNVTPVQKAQ